eukprot:1246997-Heterocapsa_arctica.AAC.1
MIASDKLQERLRFSTRGKRTLELSAIPHLPSHAGVTMRVRGLVIEHMLKTQGIAFLNATSSSHLFSLRIIGDRTRRDRWFTNHVTVIGTTAIRN